jgi:hypothetical protein
VSTIIVVERCADLNMSGVRDKRLEKAADAAQPTGKASSDL